MSTTSSWTVLPLFRALMVTLPLLVVVFVGEKPNSIMITSTLLPVAGGCEAVEAGGAAWLLFPESLDPPQPLAMGRAT